MPNPCVHNQYREFTGSAVCFSVEAASKLQWLSNASSSFSVQYPYAVLGCDQKAQEAREKDSAAWPFCKEQSRAMLSTGELPWVSWAWVPPAPSKQRGILRVPLLLRGRILHPSLVGGTGCLCTLSALQSQLKSQVKNLPSRCLWSGETMQIAEVVFPPQPQLVLPCLSPPPAQAVFRLAGLCAGGFRMGLCPEVVPALSLLSPSAAESRWDLWAPQQPGHASSRLPYWCFISQRALSLVSCIESCPELENFLGSCVRFLLLSGCVEQERAGQGGGQHDSCALSPVNDLTV